MSHTPLIHTQTQRVWECEGCCIKNNIVVWSTKIRKFIQRIAWCYGQVTLHWGRTDLPHLPLLPLLRLLPLLLCLRNRKDKANLPWPPRAQALSLVRSRRFYEQPKSKSSSSSSSWAGHTRPGRQDLGPLACLPLPLYLTPPVCVCVAICGQR